jgi:hypothetical protein
VTLSGRAETASPDRRIPALALWSLKDLTSVDDGERDGAMTAASGH